VQAFVACIGRPKLAAVLWITVGHTGNSLNSAAGQVNFFRSKKYSGMLYYFPSPVE